MSLNWKSSIWEESLSMPAMESGFSCFVLANVIVDTKDRIKTHTIYYDDIEKAIETGFGSLLQFFKWYISDFWDINDFYWSAMYATLHSFLRKQLRSWNTSEEEMHYLIKEINRK